MHKSPHVSYAPNASIREKKPARIHAAQFYGEHRTLVRHASTICSATLASTMMGMLTVALCKPGSFFEPSRGETRVMGQKNTSHTICHSSSVTGNPSERPLAYSAAFPANRFSLRTNHATERKPCCVKKIGKIGKISSSDTRRSGTMALGIKIEIGIKIVSFNSGWSHAFGITCMQIQPDSERMTAVADHDHYRNSV